ncbi:hypothetical protein SLS62_005182 [Diatrype stigma]|uniref:Helicase C-terminal domain-containing protein n=1 Tax=Diatrype stigma TaxID=117547 RepID=A0AAN9YT19_9PEZI
MAATSEWPSVAGEPWVSKYIPAGCLDVPSNSPDLPPEIWMLAALEGWKFFSCAQDHNLIPEASRLLPIFQQALLQTPALHPFLGLWKKQWIQLSFRATPGPDAVGRVRVYILPHDTTRGRTSGTESEKLTKTIPKLISSLDYSSHSWEGQANAIRQTQPLPFGNSALPIDGHSSPSLLDMFNNVPSPRPDPNIVVSPDTRNTMQCLLESKISGLTTTLYPYQRNSAALMLQREMEPRRVIDPRLKSSLDQTGKPWYFDTVTGLVLREPNYYDAPRGGILAEEMGTGKTLICLALILATRQEPTRAPEPFIPETPHRTKKASLMDMAAATANKASVAWKPYFEACRAQLGLDYENCISALEKPENHALYRIQKDALIEPRRSVRTLARSIPFKEVLLSCCNLIIAPNNLVTQWKNEIKKHTSGLKVLVMVDKAPIPQVTVLLTYDVIIFSQSRFELIEKERRWFPEAPLLDIYCPLDYIHFKRCIIDEGHKLGAQGPGFRSDMMRVIDRLEIAARWVVTGTPSRGLYGTSQDVPIAGHHQSDPNSKQPPDTAIQQEREDLQRIGNLAAKYLKVRPWANSKDEPGDTVADWNIYVMNRKQHSKGHNRRDCLKGTLDSLIIRHRLGEVSQMLPPVNKKVVVLDGSFQDKLALNLFSMVIIFNSVQSQRTDIDYLFHPRQRKSLIELVKNLRQASFFGGSFFSAQDITKAVQIAEEFLEKKTIPISPEDEKLLKEAIDFGKLAAKNKLKDVSNQFQTLPIYLENFPGGNGINWSLDNRGEDGEPICTDAGLVLALQKYLNPCIDAPNSLQLMIETGRLDSQGKAVRTQALTAAAEAAGRSPPHESQVEALAGHTPLGDDHHAKQKSGTLADPTSLELEDQSPVASTLTNKIDIAEPLAKTRMISTASAKLSYLIDSIVKYQDEEQIIVFYDNNSIAYYLSVMLDILQIKHLIYSRVGLSAERRAQYIATFTENAKFRVLLMDISQAAFGLDMRSASRIYFLAPVLNPQVEAQAIGRARRISQQKPVTVETLVLRGSIEELIVQRRHCMTQAEHRRVSSILDDRPMYEWILNVRIMPMDGSGADGGGGGCGDGLAQTAALKTPQFVFGRGFGRNFDPDEGLLSLATTPDAKKRDLGAVSMTEASSAPRVSALKLARALKRPHSPAPPLPADDDGAASTSVGIDGQRQGQKDEDGESASLSLPKNPAKRLRARMAWADDDEAS